MTAPVSKHLGNDSELVTAAQEGDEEAFVSLYERHAPVAWRTSLALTGTADDAKAVLAESFARAFTAVRTGRVDAGTTFRTLLLTSVRNATLDRRRDDAEAPDRVPAYDYADEDGRVLGAAFGPLPERWRTALWLTEVEGFRAKQVAPIIGLASPATMNLIGRAHSGLGEQYLKLQVGQVNDRTCSRSVARLGSYVSGTLTASDAEKLERHLNLCDACAARHAQLRDLGQGLRGLIIPLPEDLVDDARTAWAAAVATPVARTGTGLSPTAEKVLAGVSAVAAAVGVLGATMFGASNGAGDDQAAAVAPAADSSDPLDDNDPLAGVTPVDLPVPVSSAGTSTGGDSLGTDDRQATTTTPASSNDGVVGASGPGGTRAPANPIDPHTAAPGSEGSGGSVDGATEPSAPPPAKVDTTIADTPVSVEVSEDPGITVGDVTAGSEPDTAQDDGSTVSVGGALEPLAPAVEPVDQVVTGITKTLAL